MTQYSVHSGDRYQVTLDGHRVFAAQLADDEAGTVQAPLVNAEGPAIFDHSRGDFALVERRGRVELTPIPTTAPFAWRHPFADDYPFRVELAREGELGPDYARPRFDIV